MPPPQHPPSPIPPLRAPKRSFALTSTARLLVALTLLILILATFPKGVISSTPNSTPNSSPLPRSWLTRGKDAIEYLSELRTRAVSLVGEEYVRMKRRRSKIPDGPRVYPTPPEHSTPLQLHWRLEDAQTTSPVVVAAVVGLVGVLIAGLMA